MPYTATSEAASASTWALLAAMAASAPAVILTAAPCRATATTSARVSEAVPTSIGPIDMGRVNAIRLVLPIRSHDGVSYTRLWL